MKKTLLFFVTSSLFFSASAQISISKGNLSMGIGDQYVISYDLEFLQENVTSGANQNWDYSTLQAYPTYTYFITRVNPEEVGLIDSFPEANFVIKQSPVEADEPFYSFYSLEDNEYLYYGAHNVEQNYIDKVLNPKTVLKFPISYTNSFQDTSGSTYESDSNKTEYIYYTNTIADAWGTLSIPLGNLPVIRLLTKEIYIYNDYEFVAGSWNLIDQYIDTSYKHFYYSNDPSVKFPVLESTTNESGTSVEYPYFITELPFPLSTKTPQNINFMIYPNPSADFIQILSDGVVQEVQIFDLQGKQVYAHNQNGKNIIDIKSLASGNYIIRVRTNNTWEDQKFTKN